MIRALNIALLGLTLLVGRAACSMPAHAQSPEHLRATLLRAIVAEATWLERDHRAILHVLQRRAARAGASLEHVTRRYVSVFKVGAPARPWVLELEPTCEQPPSWPSSLDWEAHRMQCELTVERVDAFLAGDSIDPCKGRAWHWGARNLPSDVERASRAGWRPLHCGTANAFYAERRVLSATDARGTR